jgi:hypothetical protein
MIKSALLTGVFGLSLLAITPAASEAAVYAPSARTADRAGSFVAPAQHWRPGPRHVGPRFIGPRGPRFVGPRVGPRFYGPRGGYVYARPWVRRPYYGRIIAGVALGTIVTVAAVGLIPRRPAPDLCWYWADPYQNRGYWDYCY